MRPSYSLLIPPNSEPITTAQAADHVRIDSDDDLSYLTDLIPVGREYVDGVTGRVSIESTWLVVSYSWEDLMEDCVGRIPLYRVPLVSVSSISYYPQGSGTLTVLDPENYIVVLATEPGVVQIVGDLPDVDFRPDAVQIAFVAGYASSDATPPMLKHAVKLTIANFYEQRNPVNIGGSVSEMPLSLRTIIENQKVGGWSA